MITGDFDFPDMERDITTTGLYIYIERPLDHDTLGSGGFQGAER